MYVMNILFDVLIQTQNEEMQSYRYIVLVPY